MSLFGFLFGPKASKHEASMGTTASESSAALSRGDPFGPDFRTPEWAIQEAFDQVMASVEVAPSLRESLLKAFSVAHQSGDTRAEEKVVISLLAKSGWRWKDFDEWSQRFAVAKEWPYMWYQFGDISKSKPITPTTANDAIARMNVAEMRSFAQERGPIGKPIPRARMEFENLLVANVPLPELIVRVTSTLDEDTESYRARREKARCKLLAHTLSMRAYSIRRAELLNELVAIGYRLEISLGTGCPVEERYAEMFNSGKIGGLPPFFPGDRNRIVGRTSDVSKK